MNPRRSCVAVLATFLIPAFGCLTVEHALVFHPVTTPRYGADGNWYVEDAQFITEDGLSLHGWLREHPQPKAVVLYLHGNGGNVTDCHDALYGYLRMGATCFAFDYRGFGKSEGEPDEAGILKDARAARRWLSNRTGVAEQDIVLAGYSLGGGVAIDLAAKDGARGLILENTFTSLPDVAEYHFPLLPVHSLMATRLDSVSKISRYRGPLLQTHGDADEVVPYGLGKKLFQAANEPKQFVRIEGGKHGDVWAGEWATLNSFEKVVEPNPKMKPYHDALKHFLETLPPPKARS